MPIKLLPRVTCPHCWHIFATADILWVSVHADLRGDPQLGPDAQQRFLPSRFNPAGDALDARGYACRILACPRCHLVVPRALLEMEPFFVSILGTPSCGKSFYLASLIWELRKKLAKQLALDFGDADPTANLQLAEYEKALFLNPDGETSIPLAQLIRKTELHGESYDEVAFGNQTVSYPRPFLFWIKPKPNHPNAASTSMLSRTLVLYDNAGEHCLPGQDTTGSPATQHIAHSRVLLFLFDPTQDVRFRKAAGKSDVALESVTNRQEAVLHEMGTRVRKYLRLGATAKHDRPLFVVVTKFDVWSHLLDRQKGAANLRQEPWVSTPVIDRLDRDCIDARSAAIRKLLLEHCPGVVEAAEQFASRVTYLPVSALGTPPHAHPNTAKPAIRPGDIRPIWVTVPLVAALQESVRGMISQRREVTKPTNTAVNGEVASKARV
jgi:hypothetical protein